MLFVVVIFSFSVIMWCLCNLVILFSWIVLCVYCCGYRVFELFCVWVFSVMLCWLCVVFVEMCWLLFSIRFNDIYVEVMVFLVMIFGSISYDSVVLVLMVRLVVNSCVCVVLFVLV